MNIPQDDAIGNILPFPQRFQPTAETREQPPAARETAAARPSSENDADLVLSIENILQPLSGSLPTVHHLRALPLGISSGALYPHTVTELVPAAAARLGIQHVELMLQTASEYEAGFGVLLKRNARMAGVNIFSIHSRHQLHLMPQPYERRQRDARNAFRQAIDLTANVGAGVLVWHGIDRHRLRSDDDWERFFELAHDLAEDCAAAGIALGIENVSAAALATVRDVARIATRLNEIGGKDRVGFVFDPFQAVEAGANPFMMLAAMGNRLINVHISDASETDKTSRHLPPGDGNLPWSALLRAIAGSGYNGPLMIEGPLGTDDRVMQRIRATFDPLFRNVFNFPPDGIVENRPLIEIDDWTTRTDPPDGIRKGIALFNQRRFYEQHEEIEHEWHAEKGPLRRLYQGLLQIGVGYFHTLKQNHQGAVIVLTQGIEKVSAFTPHALGIDTARLVQEAQTTLDRIITLGPDNIGNFDPTTIPTIHPHRPNP
ncbi:MAG: DUF309 domain-containing protein [Thermomicrobiales bacterium]